MGSLGSPPKDVHIVIVALPFYGHVRPLRSLAHSLVAGGYKVTFIAGSVNKKSIESIPGIEFVTFTGKSDFDPDGLDKDFPGRPTEGITVVWDMEHIFLSQIHNQHNLVQEVLQKIQAKGEKAVILQDGSFSGTLPMLLDSPSAIRVPVIGIGHFPLMILSEDTAPFGPGLSPQSKEVNRQMNQGCIEMFAGVQKFLNTQLERYACPKALPSQFCVDNWILLPDLYLQLCVPALEYTRSDLPSNVRYVGTLTGGNDKRQHPDWWDSFITNPKHPEHPLIIVTSGSLPGQKFEHLIQPTIEACSSLPVRLVVCAVHVPLPESYGPLPDNVRWATWIAFEEIFPLTSLIVSSGGYGGISQAFAAGIPMVLAGTGEDKVETALRAEMTGAAVNLRTQTPSVEEVRGGIERVLGKEGGYKAKAAELSQAYKELDALGSIVGAVEELAGNFDYGEEFGKRVDVGAGAEAEER